MWTPGNEHRMVHASRSSGPLTRAGRPLAQAGRPLAQEATIGQVPAVKEFDLAEVWRMLRKWKKITLVCVVFAMALAAAGCVFLPRKYKASARIDIDLSSVSPMEELGTQVTPTDEDPETRLASQVEILTTDAIAWDVIRSLHLNQNLAFTGKSDLGSPSENLDTVDAYRRHVLLKKFHNDLTAELVPKTEVVEVTFKAGDPALAAKVPNAVASRYIEGTFSHKYAASMQAAHWLEQQVDSLKENVEKTQQVYADFQKQKGIVLTDETEGSEDERERTSGNIVLTKLVELNRSVADAEADRILKESRYRMASTHDAGVISGISNDQTLDLLRKEEMDLKADYARENSNYGSNFPRVAALAQQIDSVHQAINKEVDRLATTAQADFETAERNEGLLKTALEAEKQEALKQNQDTITLEVLKRDAETSRDLYESVVKKLRMAGVTAGLAGSNLTLVDPATVPALPSQPKIPLLLGLGLFTGLFSGIALSFAAESLDKTIRTPEDAEAMGGIQALGMIPAMIAPKKTPIMLAKPASPGAEAFRCLRSAILFSRMDEPPQAIMFTSSLPKEGKSTCSVNTAIVLAQNNHRVLLVDGDMRRPSLHSKLNIANTIGLSQMLTGEDPEKHVVPVPGVPGLDVLTAGERCENPAELLSSARTRDLVEVWRRKYEYIIVDTPPVLGMADSGILSTMLDAVILVVRSSQTHRISVRRSRDLLEKISAPLIGVLVNGIDVNSESHYDYYGYYGKSYSSYYLKGQSR